MPYSTLSTLDAYEHNDTPVGQTNEESFTRAVQEAFDVHNAALQANLSDFALVTNRYLMPWGDAGSMEMQELDQYGTPDAEKVSGGGNYGLPLRNFGKALQWTRAFIWASRINKLANQINAAAEADVRNLTRQTRRSLFNPLNNLTYLDINDTGLTLELRALLNGDGRTIPMGPNGEVFPGSHNHFTAEASLTEANLVASQELVLEHGISGSLVTYINKAQEAAVRLMTTFERYVDSRIVPATNDSYAAGNLNVTNPGDRAIGLLDGAEVWVKPWVPANYQVTFDRGVGEDRALAIRTRSGQLTGTPENGGFGTMFEDEVHPLRATGLGRWFGIGVINPQKAAVHYSGGGTYVVPSFA